MFVAAPPVSHDESHGDILDEPEPVVAARAERAEHPLANMSDEEIARAVKHDIESLGSMSVGRPGGGRLINGVRVPESDRWQLADPGNAWGTRETVEYLERAVAAVHEQFPDTPKLYIGDLSAQRGGPLSPHLSHQSGRDADVGYYLKTDQKWYARASEKNLDVARSWALVKALITLTDVKYIFIDHSIQKLLREHAESVGEDAGWLESVFDGRRGEPAIIRHVRGHATHLHVRFYNPVAQETARRAYRALIDAKLVKPPVYYVHYRVRKGDTLGKLARRYGVTVREIQRANGLRSTVIRAKVTYKIPKKGGVQGGSGPVEIPPRRLPPPKPSETRVEQQRAGGTRPAG